MTGQPVNSRKDWIAQTLQSQFNPSHIFVSDDSHRHEGHSGWREGGETHFSIEIVSALFEGKSRLDRHRLINESLAEAFREGLHALAIKAHAPSEHHQPSPTGVTE